MLEFVNITRRGGLEIHFALSAVAAVAIETSLRDQGAGNAIELVRLANARDNGETSDKKDSQPFQSHQITVEIKRRKVCKVLRHNQMLEEIDYNTHVAAARAFRD